MNPDELPPDDFTFADLVGNRELVRDVLRFVEQMKSLEVLVACEKRVLKLSEHADNMVLDLRVELPAAPVLTVTENDPVLAVTWVLEETGYTGMYLERSEGDDENFVPIANLAGDVTSYDDADVVVGIEYFYRVRGRRCGVHSPWSNIDSGELTASDTFFQGFNPAAFSDPLWTADFSEGMSGANPGDMRHAGNMFLSRDGLTTIVKSGLVVLVVVRNPDDTFTVTELNDGGGEIDFGFTMSTDGKIAGTISGEGAYWTSAAASPTIDTDISGWSYISPDGLRLYGTKVSNDDVIERVIGGGDTVIEAGSAGLVAAISDDGLTCVVASDYVYLFRKIAGTWTNVGTLADETGDPDGYPAVVALSADGTLAIGNVDLETSCTWDTSGSGTITATQLPVFAGASGDRSPTAMTPDGAIVVGYCVNSGETDYGCYWLASESYATCHNLADYLNGLSLGVTFGIGNDTYSTDDNTVVSSTGQHFLARCTFDPAAGPGQRCMWYAEIPPPS